MRFGWQQLKDKMKRLYGMTRDGSKNVTFSDNVTVLGNFVADTNQEKTGWNVGVKAGVVLSFDDGNMRLTVTGVEDYWVDDVKHTVSSPDTVDLDGTEGLWYIYYVGTVLTASQTPWDVIDNDLAKVALVYWDATNSTAIYAQWEMHLWLMDSATHETIHETFRSLFSSGFGITDNADGTLDLATGSFHDEDIHIATVDGSGSALWEQPHTPLEAPVLYLNGAGADVRSDYGGVNTYICLQDGGDNPYWNQFTGGAWQNTPSDNNKHMAMWLIATPCILHPLMWLMGQVEPTVLLTSAIEDNTLDSIAWASLPFEEVKVLYRVIIKNSGAPYTVAQIDDFRTVSGVGVSTGITNSHASNPDLTTSGHPADIIYTDTTNFTGILSAADTDVQAALETLDDEALNIDGSTAMTGAFDVGNFGITNAGAIAGATTISASSTINAAGRISSGTDDTVSGFLVAYGHATGSAEGGELRLYTAADHDDPIDYYYIDAYEDDLRFRDEDGNGYMQFVGGTSIQLLIGLDINSQAVTNLPAGSATGHPVEYDQLNTALADYLPLAGSTMVGDIDMHGNNINMDGGTLDNAVISMTGDLNMASQDINAVATMLINENGYIECASYAGAQMIFDGSESAVRLVNLNFDTNGDYKVNDTQVVTAQQAAVVDAAGGATVDTEARAAINALLARVRTHGLIDT